MSRFRSRIAAVQMAVRQLHWRRNVGAERRTAWPIRRRSTVVAWHWENDPRASHGPIHGRAPGGRRLRPQAEVVGRLALLLLLLALTVCLACSVCRAEETVGAVRCVVKLRGTPPKPILIKLDAEMAAAMETTHYQDEKFLVGRDDGLANCVVLLRTKDPQKNAALEPLEPVTFEKIGVRFVPRVLVVTPQTEVILRNDQSPCRGFQTSSLKERHRFSEMIMEGRRKSIRFMEPDICAFSCPLRPYAGGFVLVVDTPYFAVSNSDGLACVPSIPPDEYEVSLWHESLRPAHVKKSAAKIVVKAGQTTELRLEVPAPKPMP